MKINCIYIKKTKEEKLQTLDFTMVRCNPTYIHFPQDLESFQTLQLDFFFYSNEHTKFSHEMSHF